MSKLCAHVRYEPQVPAMLEADTHNKERLEKEGWLPFFQKFSGHNFKVTKSFALNLNGDKAQVRNVLFRLTEDLVARACGISQDGERWFKNQ